MFNIDKTIMSGSEIDAVDPSDLKNRIRFVSIFYRTTPAHKMKIVKALQEGGSIVAMTGDGGKNSCFEGYEAD